MLLRLILLSLFQDLSGFLRDALDVDISSLFIVGEPPHRV
jgi:hypothetical protein